MVDFVKHPRLNVFKSELVSGARFSATYEFPLLERTYFVPEKAIPFEKASKATDHRQWVHFYTHDRNYYNQYMMIIADNRLYLRE